MKLAGLLGACFFLAASPVRAQVAGKVLVDGQPDQPVVPGQPALLTFGFTRGPDHELIQDFDLDHGKYMHLIVVSQDLQTFAHLHPDLALASAVFKITVNAPSEDPDNQDAIRAITLPGTALLFAEIKPHAEPEADVRLEVQAAGTPDPRPLEPDPIDPSGRIRKHFTADGSPGQPGDEYRATLKVSTMGQGASSMVHLDMVLDRLTPTSSADPTYAPVTDLEPWLGMLGHAVVIGAAGSTAADKVFRHLHAGHHGAHALAPPGAVGFALSGDAVPPAGLYKVWVQIKTRGRILSLPFVFPIGDTTAAP